MGAFPSKLDHTARYSTLPDSAPAPHSGQDAPVSRRHSSQSGLELDNLGVPPRRDAIAARPPLPENSALAGRIRAAFQRQPHRSEDLEAGQVIPAAPEEVMANTYSTKKALRNFGVVGRRGAFWAGAISGSYAVAQTLMKKNLSPDSLATATGFLYMGLPAVAGKQAYDFFEGSYTAFGKNARIFPIEAMLINHENDKAHFAEVQKIISVPDYISKPAKMVDILIDKDLARFQKIGTENVSADQIELTDRRRNWKLDFITRRPTGLKPIDDWKTAEGRDRLDLRVERKLEDVNEADKVFIRLLVDRVCSTSVKYQRYKAGVMADTPAQQRVATPVVEEYQARGANFIVSGNPGVGKTYTIKNVLGEAVQASVIEITIPSDEEGGFAVLLPKDWDILNQTGFVPKPEDVLGKIIQALMEGKSENIVLYFNEVNARSPLTIDGFKRLLDRTNEFIKNTPLATMFHIAPVTIIIDLNPSPENEKFLKDPAVIDRCIVHEWSPAVTVGLAAKRLRAAIEENSGTSCLDIQNTENPDQPHPPVLDPSQQADLHAMLDQIFPTLLRQHRLTTGSARTEFVGMLVPYIADSLRRHQPKTQGDIESYIVQHYAQLREAQGDALRPQAEAEAEVHAWLSNQATPARGAADPSPASSSGGLLPSPDLFEMAPDDAVAVS